MSLEGEGEKHVEMFSRFFLACGAAGIFLLCLLGAVMSEQMEAMIILLFFFMGR